MTDARLRDKPHTNLYLTDFQFCDFEQIMYKISSIHCIKWQ